MMILNKQTFYKVCATLSFATASVITMLISPTAAKSELQAPKTRGKLASIVTAKNKQVKFKLPVTNNFPQKIESTLAASSSNPLLQNRQSIPVKSSTLIANAVNGMASWYGPGFDGRLTANGEVYNQEALTAAHPSLEFGTQVQVTNLNNGRSVVVTINDRGPYAEGRVIDLSAAAARTLNMISSGVAPVELTILSQ
jgi:rare lipoprotein A